MHLPLLFCTGSFLNKQKSKKHWLFLAMILIFFFSWLHLLHLQSLSAHFVCLCFYQHTQQQKKQLINFNWLISLTFLTVVLVLPLLLPLLLLLLGAVFLCSVFARVILINSIHFLSLFLLFAVHCV